MQNSEVKVQIAPYCSIFLFLKLKSSCCVLAWLIQDPRGPARTQESTSKFPFIGADYFVMSPYLQGPKAPTIPRATHWPWLTHDGCQCLISFTQAMLRHACDWCPHDSIPSVSAVGSSFLWQCIENACIPYQNLLIPCHHFDDQTW